MVQDKECVRKCSKQVNDSGEPAAKKCCVSEKPSKYTTPFNGINENKAKAEKRAAPQDSLSAQVVPKYCVYYYYK